MSFFEPPGSLNIMFDVQRHLSRGQAIPIVGPLIVSPIKAVVSLVQLAVGFIFFVVFGVIAILCCNNKVADWCATRSCHALTHAGLGLFSLAYSLGNMATLGILGFRIECIEIA